MVQLNKRYVLLEAIVIAIVVIGVLTWAVQGIGAHSGQDAESQSAMASATQMDNEDLPEGAFYVVPDNREPGAQGDISWHISLGDNDEAPVGWERVHEQEYIYYDFDLSECSVSDAGPSALERDGLWGDGENYSTFKYVKGNSFEEDRIWVEYYRGDEISAPRESYGGGPGQGEDKGRNDGDGNYEFYADDLLHVVFNDCAKNPEDPGWYRMKWFQNGTNFNGYEEGQEISQEESMEGDYAEVERFSDYVWICDCENEQEAREELGPPPDAEQTPTPDGGADPTPTPTITTETPVDEPTETDDNNPSTETTEDTPVDTPEASPDNTPDDTPSNDQDDDTGGDEDNPTPGDGPGFGPVIVLIAFVTAIKLLGRAEGKQ